MNWDRALDLLRRQQRQHVFGFSPAVVRPQLEADPELATAALTLIAGVFVEGRSSTDGERLEPLLEGAAMILAEAGGYEQPMLDVAFRVASPANYRILVPLLRIVVTDDGDFERAVIDALGSDDEQIAARALAIQYSAWGFRDRFALSAEGRDAVARAVARLRERRSATLDAALAGYVAPT